MEARSVSWRRTVQERVGCTLDLDPVCHVLIRIRFCFLLRTTSFELDADRTFATISPPQKSILGVNQVTMVMLSIPTNSLRETITTIPLSSFDPGPGSIGSFLRFSSFRHKSFGRSSTVTGTLSKTAKI